MTVQRAAVGDRVRVHHYGDEGTVLSATDPLRPVAQFEHGVRTLWYGGFSIIRTRLNTEKEEK